MKKHAMIGREEVPRSHRDVVTYCFYCYCPRHPRSVTAVAAVEVAGELPHEQKCYFGICGNHAEAYPFTEEEEKQTRNPMLCIHCFSQEDLQESPGKEVDCY